MELKDFKFPEVTNLDMAFSTFDTEPKLLLMAEQRNPEKAMKKFDELFYSGGKVELQQDVEGSWKEQAYIYAIALMKSGHPKHEHKRIVVAYHSEKIRGLSDPQPSISKLAVLAKDIMKELRRENEKKSRKRYFYMSFLADTKQGGVGMVAMDMITTDGTHPSIDRCERAALKVYKQCTKVSLMAISEISESDWQSFISRK